MSDIEQRIDKYERSIGWHWVLASAPVVPVFFIGSNVALAICTISLIGALVVLDARLYAIAQRIKLNNDLLHENAESLRN